MWGRLGAPHRLDVRVRFTPTYVGKTGCNRTVPFWRPVHPHVCGEDGPVALFTMYEFGSPPRMWGRLPDGVCERQARRFTPTYVGKTEPVRPRTPGPRFTPTYVGKTYSNGSSIGYRTVHPHVCGEDAVLAVQRGHGAGSPPRMWGRPSPSSTERHPGRFTPTYVGKTSSWRRPRTRTAVHPHVCGEDSYTEAIRFITFGSPPRMWGRRVPSDGAVDAVRFTPTYVGKTAESLGRPDTASVHPHVCGEDAPSSFGLVEFIGSPPRMWGRRENRRSEYYGLRFTPTYVGKTPAGAWCPRRPSVHPHVCGEDTRSTATRMEIIGSPPRMWGRPHLSDAD